MRKISIYLLSVTVVATIFAAGVVPAEVGFRHSATVPVCEMSSVKQARLLFAGDVMQHIPQVNAARVGDGYDYRKSFEYIKEQVSAADVAIVNLETTLSECEYSGYPLFRSPVALGTALADAGFDIAVLANNHCCDGGDRGITTTIATLSDSGIQYVGVSADSIDYIRRTPLYFNARGIRCALFNYTYALNGNAVPRGRVVNITDTLQIASELARVDTTAVDCVIAYMHWGEEYERYPNRNQRSIAKFLQAHGVDIIVGSHPHVVQPLEVSSSKVTLYSLGNFVSNQRKRYTDGGIMAEIDIVKVGSGKPSFVVRTTPVWVVLPRYRIIPRNVGDTLTMSRPSRWLYNRFMTDTDSLLRCRP